MTCDAWLGGVREVDDPERIGLPKGHGVGFVSGEACGEEILASDDLQAAERFPGDAEIFQLRDLGSPPGPLPIAYLPTLRDGREDAILHLHLEFVVNPATRLNRRSVQLGETGFIEGKQRHIGLVPVCRLARRHGHPAGAGGNNRPTSRDIEIHRESQRARNGIDRDLCEDRLLAPCSICGRPILRGQVKIVSRHTAIGEPAGDFARCHNRGLAAYDPNQLHHGG